jgi:hypothetical protein
MVGMASVRLLGFPVGANQSKAVPSKIERLGHPGQAV